MPPENVTARSDAVRQVPAVLAARRAARRPHLADQADREGAPLVLASTCATATRPSSTRWTRPASCGCSRPSCRWASRRSRSGSRRRASPTSTSSASIIEDDLVPDDVTIQVLVQCRPELIERTYECLQGTNNAIVHFYNSTSVLQRRVVFGLDQAGITQIAVDAAKLCRKLEATLPGSHIRYEYSPESFTGTEADYAVEICEAVMEVIEPTVEDPLVMNLPATVEMFTPNIYADVIEWFGRTVRDRDKVCLSLHPHNDRGTAVAAAELGDHGRRRPGRGHPVRQRRAHRQRRRGQHRHEPLQPGRRSRARHHRHRPPAPGHGVLQPAAGAHPPPLRRRPRLHVVLREPPGRHQEGLRRARRASTTSGACRTCPIDPKHVGRTYEAVIRVNSQSGKGGVAYIMKEEHGLDLPRRLQIEFSKTIQTITEDTGTVIEPADIWATFIEEYLPEQAPRCELLAHEITTSDHGSSVTAQLLVDGEHVTVTGQGGGPIASFVAALQADLGVDIDVVDYSEHAVSAGSDATAVAYVETTRADGTVKWGVGMHESILTASLRAVVSAVNRHRAEHARSSSATSTEGARRTISKCSSAGGRSSFARPRSSARGAVAVRPPDKRSTPWPSRSRRMTAATSTRRHRGALPGRSSCSSALRPSGSW